MSEENEYSDVYKTLDSNKLEIRILRLKSRRHNRDNQQDDQRIFCEVEHTSLDNSVDYMALSYVWENGSDPQEVFLSGNARWVSANLTDALRQLRDEFDDILLWTDQLCINQQDAAEKPSQILRMRDIYEGASQVIAWLGVSADGSDLVLTTLRQMEKHRDSSWNKSILSDISLEIGRSTMSCHEQVLNPAEVVDTLRTALPAFAARRYWTRLWVLQEFTLAGKLLIMCGSETISDITFERAWNVLGGLTSGKSVTALHVSRDMRQIARAWRCDPLWWDAWLGVKRFNAQRNDYHDPRYAMDGNMFMTTYRTLTTLYGQSHMSCTDPRDRVFSLLGLATNSDDFGHFPDYTQSTEMIYEELARKFVQQRHVDAFSFCQEDPNRRARNMPSWATDLSLNIRLPLWGKVPLDASQGWTADLEPSMAGEKAMNVSGICVGTVQSIGSQWSHDGPLSLRQTQEFLNQLRAFYDQSSRLTPNNKDDICAQLAAPVALAYLKDEDLIVAQYQDLCNRIIECQDQPNDLDLDVDMDSLSTYEKELRLQLFRCPFITRNGYIGIAQPYIDKGDYICIFPGGSMPYILRSQPTTNLFRVIGAAYVYGIMNGEYFEENRDIQSFSLI